MAGAGTVLYWGGTLRVLLCTKEYGGAGIKVWEQKSGKYKNHVPINPYGYG
jgi:hypothetical protein